MSVANLNWSVTGLACRWFGVIVPARTGLRPRDRLPVSEVLSGASGWRGELDVVSEADACGGKAGPRLDGSVVGPTGLDVLARRVAALTGGMPAEGVVVVAVDEDLAEPGTQRGAFGDNPGDVLAVIRITMSLPVPDFQQPPPQPELIRV
ncbi:hypothetical protein [Actinomadura xylanilytica]|uniref:hypothetical protein n=1 Tax=Actinomadura xylanilytica TaxID=887459 RepID=UPI00255AC9BE|nr:hypothetical protein [Actinomadura xylanilytica]MDL4776653.1 hypothetical protein [Actinomadura xylanilytica]